MFPGKTSKRPGSLEPTQRHCQHQDRNPPIDSSLRTSQRPTGAPGRQRTLFSWPRVRHSPHHSQASQALGQDHQTKRSRRAKGAEGIRGRERPTIGRNRTKGVQRGCSMRHQDGAARCPPSSANGRQVGLRKPRSTAGSRNL